MQVEEVVVNNPCAPQLELRRTWKVSGRLCAVLVLKENTEEMKHLLQTGTWRFEN